jgi:hypothetical protein
MIAQTLPSADLARHRQENKQREEEKSRAGN